MPKSTEKSKTSGDEKSDEKSKVEQDGDDDWDSLFTDDGECLDPDMMKELTAAVKNVQIVEAPAATSVVHAEFDDEFAVSHLRLLDGPVSQTATYF